MYRPLRDSHANRTSPQRNARAHRVGERARPGFTLIEMLVVLGIILLLASLTIAFLPNINDHERATQGALTVQNALATARHRALRDQTPRGVRLVADATITTAATTLQYIEQPEDFTGGYIQIAAPSGSTATATLSNAPGSNAPDLFGGFGSGNQAYWAVQVNDYLVLNGTQVYQITAVTSSTTFTINTAGTSPNGSTTLTKAVLPSTNYSIMRAPRPLTGDDPIQLPDKIGIDFGTTYTGPNSSGVGSTVSRSALAPDSRGGQNYYDILFDSSGRVLRQGVATGKIMLWVRDVTDANMGGDQVLVTVFTRTGQVAPAQVDPGPNNDYFNTQQDTTTGLYYYMGTTRSPYTFAVQGQGAGL